MIRALFLADSVMTAEFWARAWGFEWKQWAYARRPHDLRGYDRTIPVFVCGPPTNRYRWLDDLVGHAAARGFRLIDSHNIDAVERQCDSLFTQLAAGSGFSTSNEGVAR